jgi:hypothetical protein
MWKVSGERAFSYVTSIGFFALCLTASLFAAGTGANVIYDVANSNKENNRAENYDAFGNRKDQTI